MSKQKTTSRSPLLNVKIQRYPGQNLLHRSIVQAILFAGVGGFVTGACLCFFIGQLLGVENMPTWLKAALPWLVMVFVYIPMFIWLKRVSHNLKNLTLGMKGEQVVAAELGAMRQDGYRAYHSIVLGKFDIDHLLIGPTGVYALETKTRSKKNGRDDKIVYDGKKILINGFEDERDATKQAKGNAKTLHDLLLSETGINVWVKPMVVFPGWFVRTTTPDPQVLVLNPRMIRHVLLNRPVELDALTIEQLDKAMANHQGEIYEGLDV